MTTQMHSMPSSTTLPAMLNANKQTIPSIPLVTLPPWQQACIRTLDIFVAALALLALSPVLVAIVCAIRASSRGPALFRQKRVKKGGVFFSIYKFRTMYQDAASRQALVKNEQRGGVIFKNKSDARITPLGRILRRFSLDELPQLWNVLWGDMSLVGPRPHPVSEVRKYPTSAMARLAVKPGLTGLAQVNGRSDLSFRETVAYDLQYIERKSVTTNAHILLKTLSVVVSGKGAY